MPTVQVPGVGSVQFPDGMAPEEMQRVIETEILKKPADAMSRTQTALGGFGKGVAGLAGIPSDFVRNVANLGMTGFGAAKNLITGRHDSPPVMPDLPLGYESNRGLLEKAGLQTQNQHPEDPASRMLDVGGTILGGSLGGGGIKNALMAAAGGALGSEVMPGGELIGALAPGGIQALGSKAIRATRGNAAQNLAMFKNAGVKPSAGMVTENNFYNGMENLLSKFPGSTGVMTKFREAMQKDLGAGAKTGVSAEEAGAAIERGIRGKGGFLEETKASYQALEAKLAAKVPQGFSTVPSNTMQTLDELTAATPGGAASTGGLVNKKLEQMKANLKTDMGTNGMFPFEALRRMRTQVGTMIEDTLVSGVSGGEAKQLYKALSKDMEAAANQAGAGQEFARQNAFYSARMGRIERVLDKVIGKDKNPEDIFKTFNPTDRTQFSKVTATMRSLPKAERQIVSQAVVDRMGRATPGKQNDLGDVFSSETFLTNYGKLNPKAKAVLFPDPKMGDTIDRMATAASNIRHGASVFANSSNTAGTFAGYSIYASPAVALGTGTIAPLATAAVAAGGAHLTSRLLTSPRFVEWLANGPTKNPKAIAAHFARLSVIYKTTDDEALKGDLADYISSMGGEQ